MAQYLPSEIMRPEPNRNIEQLRAFAILMVLCHHFTWLHAVMPPLLATAWSGVDLFFAISGYVIAMSLSRSLIPCAERTTFRERLSLNRKAIKTFFIKRAWRILPPLVAALGLAALLTAAYSVTTWRDLGIETAAIFSMTYNYVVYQGGPFLLDVLWSLSIEMQFYVFLPFFMLAFTTRRRQLLAAVMIVLVVGALIRPLHVWLHTASYRDLLTVRFSTHCRLDTLMMGVVVFTVSCNQKLMRGVSELAPLVIRGLIVVCIVILLFIPSATPDTFSHNIGFSVLALAGAVAVFLAVGSRTPFVSLPLLSPMLRYIGERSFSLYLVHRLAAVAFGKMFPTVARLHLLGDAESEVRTLQGIGVLLLTFSVAELMYRFVEKPGMELGRRVGYDALGQTSGDQGRVPFRSAHVSQIQDRSAIACEGAKRE